MPSPSPTSDAAPSTARSAAPAAPADAAFGPLALWGYAALVAVIGSIIRFERLSAFAQVKGDSTTGLLGKWDAAHYLGIAESGYAREDSFAFFPALPMLMRGLGALGLPMQLAGTLISIVALVFLAAGVMVLARRMGAGRLVQVLSAFVVTCAPMSIVFLMPYTEALFGALLIWAVLAMDAGKWVRAAVLVALLGFVRLTAIDVWVVLLIMVLWKARGTKGFWVALGATIAALAPLLGFIMYVNRHLPQGYFALQKTNWNSSFDFGLATMKWIHNSTLKASGLTNTDGGYLLSTLIILAVPVLLAVTARHTPPALWLFCAALSANVLLSDGVMHSRPRLLLPVAMLLVPIMVAAEKARVGRGVLVGGTILWVLWGTWFGCYMLAVFEWAI